MNILTQNYNLSNQITNSIYKNIKQSANNYSINNYIELIDHTKHTVYDLLIGSVVKSFEKIDTEYRNSKERKETYYVKVTRPRTIITTIGQITYTRTIYQEKHGTKTYCHLDRVLGLPKYDKYAPDVKAKILEYFSDSNSMIKVGKLVGQLIYSTDVCNISNANHSISRQTVKNIVSKDTIKIEYPRKKTPETIYVMADEKYLSLQNGKKQMVKAVVIFEDIKTVSKKRKMIVNKNYLLHMGSNIWEHTYDRINELYDLEKVKNIHIMGDGAKWIRSGVNELKDSKYNIDFSLDRFHRGQAIQRISKELNNILENYVYYNMKKDFKLLCELLINDNDKTNSTNQKILSNSNYILNNWSSIQRMNKEVKIGCPMEQVISHGIASIFSSVPKAYSQNNLKTYIAIRELQLNKINIASAYINSTKIKSINNEKKLKRHYYLPEESKRNTYLVNFNNTESRSVNDTINTFKFI